MLLTTHDRLWDNHRLSVSRATQHEWIQKQARDAAGPNFSLPFEHERKLSAFVSAADWFAK
jgi:hypothetical protein